jgi:hypothetical protein
MQLTTTTQVSVDGVVQENGGRDENGSGGFERGGWAMPPFDSEAMTFVDKEYQRADASLFGRPTYELCVGCWEGSQPGHSRSRQQTRGPREVLRGRASFSSARGLGLSTFR